MNEQIHKRLVYGASGYIGSNLVPALLKKGISVRACSRRPAVLEGRNWTDVEIVASDALAPDTLPDALENIEIAYYLVHSMAAGRAFGQLDIKAAQNFAAAAAEAGVKCIVYLGGLVPDNATNEHILSRRDTGNVLRQGQVPVIEVRAGIIVGPGSAAFEVMRDLVFHLPAMLTPRWVRAKSPPIALENLIEYLIQLPEKSQVEGKIFDAAGPETLSYQQMMRTLAEVAGKTPPAIIPIPFLSPKLSSYWLKFVTSVPSNIAKALVEGLKHDFYADTTEIEQLVPQPLLDFRASVEAAFAAERNCQVESRWVEGAFAMREQRIDYAYYAKSAGGSALTDASASSVWEVVSAIGGENRYYYMNLLWTIREIIDWMVGGNGLHHGRRHPKHVRVGDKVDSWEVIGVEQERRLTMRFGMRAPGAGVLEFEILPAANNKTQLKARAYWHPAGIFGIAYWLSLEPAHHIIFTGLTREICRLAEQNEKKLLQQA